MKKLIVAILFAISGVAQANPFIETNVDSSTTSCKVTVDTAAPVTVAVTNPVPPATQYRCRFDAAVVSVGSHNYVFVPTTTNVNWGVLDGAASDPFVDVRPAPPAKPVGTKIVPN